VLAHSSQGRAIQDVGPKQNEPAPCSLLQIGELLRHRGFRKIQTDHVSARVDERFAPDRSEAAAGAGDDCHTALQQP
jgi:hypothetical protein